MRMKKVFSIVVVATMVVTYNGAVNVFAQDDTSRKMPSEMVKESIEAGEIEKETEKNDNEIVNSSTAKNEFSNKVKIAAQMEDEECTISPENGESEIKAIVGNAEYDTIYIDAGEYVNIGTVKNKTVVLNGDITVTGTFGLENSTVEGNNHKISKTGGGAAGLKEAELKQTTFSVSSIGGNYAVNLSGDLALTDSTLQANGNGSGSQGAGIWVGSGCQTITASNSTIECCQNGQSGIWAGSAGDGGNPNVTVSMTGGFLLLNNNGLNGFQADKSFGKTVKPTFNLNNVTVQANGNGAKQGSGQGDGFSYGYINLTDGSFTANKNRGNGVDGGSSCAAFNADGAQITCNDNGKYGLHISKETSVIKNCTVETSGNNQDGFYSTVPTTLEKTTAKAERNGGEGLYLSSSSGSQFVESTITCNENGANGIEMSTNTTTASTITANKNGKSGIYLKADASFDADSAIVLKENTSNASGKGALYLAGSGKTVTIDARLDVQDNEQSGIYNPLYKILSKPGVPNTLKLNNGSDTLIKNNGRSSGGPEKGGGIYNEGTIEMSKGVKIYDNDAKIAGDDIYNAEGASIELYRVRTMGSDLILTNDGDDNADNNKGITNWFYDGVNKDYQGVFQDSSDKGTNHRWEKNVYAKMFIMAADYSLADDESQIFTEELALKAAYAPETGIQPVDLTLYTGGNGYENVNEADNSVQNGFPEPGYTVTLPDWMNYDINSDDELSTDLSTWEKGAQMRYYFYEGGEGESEDGYRVWELKKYSAGASSVDGKYVYSLNLDSSMTPGDDEENYPRLFITDEKGNVVTSDDFDVSDAVHKEYTTQVSSVSANEAGTDTIISNVQYKANEKIVDVDCSTELNEGKLTVRGISGVQTEGVLTDVADSNKELSQEKPLAVVDEGTEFYINGNQQMITDEEKAQLLFDEILPEGEDMSNDRRTGWLQEKAEDYSDSENIFEENKIENPSYEFKYLDLVDNENGNVWIKSSTDATVYWPYPEGTDKNTDFVLMHYKGLEREMEYDDVQDAIMNADMEEVKIEKGDNHISFKADSFSPFALVWDSGYENESSETPGGNSSDKDNPDKAYTESGKSASAKTGDSFALWICLMGLTASAVATSMVLYRRRG